MRKSNSNTSKSHAAGDVQATGVAIGVLTSIDPKGRPLVAFAGNTSDLPVAVKSTVAIAPDAVGSEVALLFEGGDVSCPIMIGVVQSHLVEPLVRPTTALRPDVSDADAQQPGPGLATPSNVHEASITEESPELLVDGKRIQLTARQEIVLRCGKASITMTGAGKVIIRGAYVSTLSSGANRIKGGSVQIN